MSHHDGQDVPDVVPGQQILEAHVTADAEVTYPEDDA